MSSGEKDAIDITPLIDLSQDLPAELTDDQLRDLLRFTLALQLERIPETQFEEEGRTRVGVGVVSAYSVLPILQDPELPPHLKPLVETPSSWMDNAFVTAATGTDSDGDSTQLVRVELSSSDTSEVPLALSYQYLRRGQEECSIVISEHMSDQDDNPNQNIVLERNASIDDLILLGNALADVEEFLSAGAFDEYAQSLIENE